MKKRNTSQFFSRDSLRKLAKKFFFIAGLGLLVFGLIWMVVEKQNLKKEAAFPPKMVELHEMLNPVYTGQDDKGMPYIIKATKGKLLNPDADVPMLHIDMPWGEFTANEGVKVQLSGTEGLYDTAARILTLKNNVRFITSDGYDFITSSAILNLKEATAKGDEAVEGKGPQGQIRAQGFRIQEKGAIVTFIGNAQAILTSKPE